MIPVLPKNLLRSLALIKIMYAIKLIRTTTTIKPTVSAHPGTLLAQTNVVAIAPGPLKNGTANGIISFSLTHFLIVLVTSELHQFY